MERTVREAGGIVREIAARTSKTWSKADGSPVTEADLAVNKYLSDNLRPARPDYAWLSEESEDDPARLTAKRVFVIDPIDGTVAFVKRRPHFTICAAVVEDGVPIAAAVYNPMLDENFTASAGGGAWLNGARLRVSDRTVLEGARILASRNVFEDVRWGWPELERDNRNSAAYRLTLVAAGRYDATISLTAKHDWDVAAADLIAREAGGMVTTHRGEPLRYNRPTPVVASVVAAGPALHRLILDRLGG
ncbi:MAG: 3'(2'),5'-bisphosphate nucleotidase CysQ [Alphaproteobacteria bacterium]|nr:3'(2'),5'-bisphosphate nucleotidase CysQ [Alphaproteobacteria bacterium]